MLNVPVVGRRYILGVRAGFRKRNSNCLGGAPVKSETRTSPKTYVYHPPALASVRFRGGLAALVSLVS